jgi:hypothetical protein
MEQRKLIKNKLNIIKTKHVFKRKVLLLKGSKNRRFIEQLRHVSEELTLDKHNNNDMSIINTTIH